MNGTSPANSANRLVIVLVALVGLGGCGHEPAAPTTRQAAAQEPALRSADAPIEHPPQEEPSDDRAEEVTRERVRPSFRPPDQRPRHDAERLAELGINEFRSTRLVLYTDIEPEIAQTLPPLLDQAFDAWQNYFGPLPPARDGSEYQLTGYLMRDQNRFRRAGLLPVTLPAFAHGKHDAQQFWLNDSEYDYYRRHLLIHEATHCFMESMGGTTLDVPVWYLEGMAELFAAHLIDNDHDSTARFRVMPQRAEEFVGFGRIGMIQRAVVDGRMLTVDQIGMLQPDDFVRHNESYAWAWALCAMMDRHPRYHDLLQSLSRTYVEEGFETANRRIFGPLLPDLAAEWSLFARHLCYGFDVERAAVEFVPGTTLMAGGSSAQTTVSAARGWQSSQIAVLQGQNYDVRAGGRTVLATTSKPWESEPQGISIEYSEGRPIGRLQGVVISEPDPETDRRHVSEVIDLGREAEFAAPINGTLYLRVNDFWNQLADNSGEYSVTVGVSSPDN